MQDIGDIVIGSVLGDSSQRAIQVRIAGLLAGIPENVPVHTVNRCEQFTHTGFPTVTCPTQLFWVSIGSRVVRQ